MVVMKLRLDATNVTPEDIKVFLEGGICLEATAVLNRCWEDYLSPDLVADYGGEQVQIQWLETDWQSDQTPNDLWLTVKYPKATLEDLEELYVEQPLTVDYHVLYSRDTDSSN